MLIRFTNVCYLNAPTDYAPYAPPCNSCTGATTGTTPLVCPNSATTKAPTKSPTNAPTNARTNAPTNAPTVAGYTYAPTNAPTGAPTPSEGYTVKGEITITGVTDDELSSAAFQTALIQTIATLTGFSTEFITLIFSRRTSSVGYQLQAASQTAANTASTVMTTAAASNTLTSTLTTQLTTSGYTGTPPTGSTATATVTSNSQSDSDGLKLWMIISIVVVAVLLVVAGMAIFCLCCRKDTQALPSQQSLGVKMEPVEPIVPAHTVGDSEVKPDSGPDVMTNSPIHLREEESSRGCC